MKTKHLLTSFLLLSTLALYGQVPQGINYQALALDVSGNPITSTTLGVRIAITSDLAGTQFIWEERHDNVLTNSRGMFSLVVGNPSAIKERGSALTFSAINWSSTPLYIITEIRYGGTWHGMGGTQLWSVPYAMVSAKSEQFDGFFTFNNDTIAILKPMAIGSTGTRNALLSVTSIDDMSEDPLFEVRRKDGKTVFAVYNEGVRVNVGSGSSKAVKGGFAIGSFDSSKGAQDLLVVNSDCVRVYLDTNPGKAVKGGFAIGSFDASKASAQDFLKVSADSIRMYIDDAPGKANKGGFAIGSFDASKSSGNNFFDISSSRYSVINPSEPRILWYPLKNAFLAGQVLITDPANVGINSLSIGYESSAQGEYSQALGYRAIAVGDYSTSIGKNSLAQGENSFAFGNSATATQNNSYAFGGGARATGLGSYAFGSVEIDTVNVIPTTNFTTASGNYSFAVGLGANSSGQMGISIGNRSQAIGRGATAIGTYSKAEGNYSFALGDGGTATGDYALSYRGAASGPYSVALGGSSMMTWASGSSAVAIGSGELITGIPMVITRTEASGSRSVAIGSGVKASGNYATAMGRDSEAQAFNSFAIGRYNVVSGSQTTWVATDPLFVIGNGTSTTPSNAVTVLKNGRTAIGHADPTQMLDVNGQVRIRGGSPAAGRVLTSAADGTATWQDAVIGTHSHSATDVTTGTLTVARGGTATGTLNANKVMVGNGASGVLTPINLHWDNTNSRLGIGTSAPSDHLHIANGSGNSRIRLSGTTGNSVLQYYNGSTFIGSVGANIDEGYLFIYQADNVSFRGGSVGIGNINPGQKLDITSGNGRVGSGYSWLTNSDSRYKKNVTTLASSLDKVLAIRGVRYDLTDDSDVIAGSGRHIGFIAQELEIQFPEFVVTDSSGYKSVAYDKMTAVLVEAIKDQQTEIETLRSELEALKALVNSMVSK